MASPSIHAMAEGASAATEFPSTTEGLQAAIDSLAGAKGKVFIGPGTLETTTAIWLHSYCHVQGSGIGLTVIKRTSMADGDATQSGCVFGTSAFGSNGTIPTSSTTQADISVSELTLDGNYSSFGAVTQANLVPAGLRIGYTDGIRVDRVRAINCLGDGFRLDQCRNAFLCNVETHTVGQWSVVAARNGVNFIGDGAGSGSWGYNNNLLGASIINTGDEAIQASNVNLLTIDDVYVDTCDYVFECSPASGTTAGTFTDWSISNIVAINVLDYFFNFSKGQGSGWTINDVAISNCAMSGHSTLHDGGAFGMTTQSACYLNRVSVTGCQFRNINTKDTTTRHWVDFQGQDATGYTCIRFAGCSFYGLSGSTRTGNEIGLHFRGQVRDVQIVDCLLRDVAGTAIRLNDTSVSAQTLRDVMISGVIVDGANDYGIRVTAAGGSGTLTNLHFLNCIVKDSNKQTTGAGIQLYCDQAGATVTKVFVRGCRVYKTSGTTLTYGLDMARSAGTMSYVTIENCDFDDTQTGWITGGSGVTNVRFHDAPFKGADVSSATTALPLRGDLFTITGTTQIDAITPFVTFDRRPITFVAGGAFTMSTGLGNLTLSGYWVPGTGDSITLRYNGSAWIEISRSQTIWAPPGTLILKNAGNLASATDVTLSSGNYFIITGATTINTIVATGNNGRVIHLFFASTPTVNNDTTSAGNIKLAGAANFGATANDSLTLGCNGTTWFEIARSVN